MPTGLKQMLNFIRTFFKLYIMQPLTQQEEILLASYKENFNYAKELKFICSPKAPKQFVEARKILNEFYELRKKNLTIMNKEQTSKTK